MSILENYIDNYNKYRDKGIFIDTGPLLLWIVGLFDKQQIERFPRLEKHSIDHFVMLNNIINDFPKIVTTPCVLTEVCDYIRQFSSPKREEVLTNCFVPSIDKMMQEEYVASSTLGKMSHFRILGLTDSSIINAAKGKYIILTEDLPLWEYLRKNKIAAVNFTHLCF